MTSRVLFLTGLLGIAALGCARATFHDIDGTAGTGGTASAGSSGRGGTGGDGGDGTGGGAGDVIGGTGGGGAGGIGGSSGLAGRGGGGGTGGGGVGGSTAGRGGSGGTGGIAGTGGRGGTGGVAGSAGMAGTGGTAGTSAGGRGGSGGGGSGGTGGVPGVMPTVAGQIVITELMHNSAGISDDLGEWFEVFNPSPTVTFDLQGCEVSDIGSRPGPLVGVPLVIPPMTFKTFAVSPSPGFTPDYVYTPTGATPTVKFSNSAGDGVVVACNGVDIDQFAYPTGLAPIEGHSFSVDPDHLSAVDNDIMANWCSARDTMAGDAYETSGPNFGTPGRANTQCP